MIVHVKLEDTQLRFRLAAPDIRVRTETRNVRSLDRPVGYVDLSSLEGCEHGGEVGVVGYDHVWCGWTEWGPMRKNSLYLAGGGVNLNVGRHGHQKC